MEITWDDIFGRIEANPVEHLGGYSPHLLGPFFEGYEHALSYNAKGGIQGVHSFLHFKKWFLEHAYGARVVLRVPAGCSLTPMRTL